MIQLSIEVSGAPVGIGALFDRVSLLCAEEEGLPGMVSFGRLVGDDEIRRINRDFRAIDRPTDVLSFPSISYRNGRTARDSLKRLIRERDPQSGLLHLGDFAISLPRARGQAQQYGHSLLRELCYLCAHAQWHLMGYDHQTEPERRVMREKEERVMRKLGLPREQEGTGMTDRDLFERAKLALTNAYVPYSRFKVGACLLDEQGNTYMGCNIENASYGATLCAERAAIAGAVSQGARKFTKIAVVGENAPAWPCGVCRQVLHEFSSDMQVICGAANGDEYQVVPLSDLLPHAFGPKDLL